MFGTTMLLTVGVALDRAQSQGLKVRVAAAGEWLTGHVVSTDGQAVVLAEENGDVCVVRAEAVSAVRLLAEQSAQDGQAERAGQWEQSAQAQHPDCRIPTQPSSHPTGY